LGGCRGRVLVAGLRVRLDGEIGVSAPRLCQFQDENGKHGVPRLPHALAKEKPRARGRGCFKVGGCGQISKSCSPLHFRGCRPEARSHRPTALASSLVTGNRAASCINLPIESERPFRSESAFVNHSGGSVGITTLRLIPGRPGFLFPRMMTVNSASMDTARCGMTALIRSARCAASMICMSSIKRPPPCALRRSASVRTRGSACGCQA